MNATPAAPIKHQNWTNNTWGLNRVLKYSGNREEYFNSSPEGYASADGLEWEESKYNSTKALTEEEQKEVNEAAEEWAKNSSHKLLDKSIWMGQKENTKQIYPVKDSHSYITPYTQRDHAFNDA